MLLSYLQPFSDGNKRTSGLLANAVLLATGCCRCRTGVSMSSHTRALILFYEQGSVAHFRDLFLEQLEFAAENYFL